MSAVEKNKDPRREEEASGLGKIHISCCHWGGGAKTGFCFFCDPEVSSLDFVTGGGLAILIRRGWVDHQAS